MDSLPDVHRRLARACDADLALGILFESSLAHVAALEGDALAARLREQLFGPKGRLVTFFKYPAAGLLKLVAATVPPDASGPEYMSGVEAFGAAAVRHFHTSAMGKVLAAMAEGHPARLLTYAPTGYRTVVTFAERSWVKRSETSGELVFKGDHLGPGWHVGVIGTGVLLFTSTLAQVTVRDVADHGMDFVLDVRW